ncbi:PAS domain S-box protein [Ramlibacter sp. H39-3-26]|nr:ATP-binding protein [Ramlibacter sp. H39-3-26]MDF1485172.1 PAS domain S-box protein [Ramlibacter sp. H39-3-26]
MVLVGAVLVTLVWLAGRYEASQVQGKLERDTADAATDIRAALARNVESLRALQAGSPGAEEWEGRATTLLREHREIMRIEWRNDAMAVVAAADTPFRAPLFGALPGGGVPSEVALACGTARRLNGPAYASTYFMPRPDGPDIKVMEVCVPLAEAGRMHGFVLAMYSLQEMLVDLVGAQLTRSQEISFTEPDGTRLALHGAALHGAARRGTRRFTAQQLMDLPGATLMLRMDNWHSAPSVFPNVLTALVTAMSIALVSVLVLLAKDTRRRLQAEHDLADALAFRKAMEDSLITGLRARDLQGRLTYVNPAFCDMVGFKAEELLGLSTPLPYWPPEHADEYQRRQATRFAGAPPSREGFESVFMHRDGTRFPVLIMEAPLINADGLHTGWMGAFLDLSEQRRVEELSRASQERLQATARLATVGEMASLMSHELNQPLAAIASYATGSANLLQQGPGVVADLEIAMRRIAEQADRAGRVIRSVHDFVRRRDQAREYVHAQALLDAIMPLVILQARKLGVRVHTRVDAQLPPVLCDATMVEQVLLNLARNAMQSMDDPAIVERPLVIQVRRAVSNATSGWLEFSVADVGPGISDSVAARLFTPFFTTKAEGMGLGLSLCRTVVEQHGGYLGFTANLPRGTVFTFTLPTKKPGSADGTYA